MITIQYLDAAKLRLDAYRESGEDVMISAEMPERDPVKAREYAELIGVCALAQLGYHRNDLLGYLSEDQRQALREVCARTIAEIDAYVPKPKKQKTGKG